LEVIWNLGFLLGITIIIQIITGIFLGLHYTSDLNSAYFSLFFFISRKWAFICLVFIYFEMLSTAVNNFLSMGFYMFNFSVVFLLFGTHFNIYLDWNYKHLEVVYPRVNNFSILILSLSYLFVILSLISMG
jgi:hypothetical protein